MRKVQEQPGDGAGHRLLWPGDPPPAVIENAASDLPLLIVCEHGGQAVPACLDNLGLPQSVLDSHAGWDIGALPVAQELATNLGAPLVHQRYSRLVIDCNRPPQSEDAMPAVIHGIAIAGNSDLTTQQRRQRCEEIFAPYDAALNRLLSKPRLAAFSIHSFTPRLDGNERPWSVGLLSRKDPSTAALLEEVLSARIPEALIAFNQPYEIEDDSDWFIPQHAERLGLAHCLFEIRNDLLRNKEDQSFWATHLSAAIAAVMEELS